MAIICSCGCRVDDYDNTYNIICQSEALDEDGYKKALSYQTVCEDCKQEYKEAGILFKNEEEAFRWLNEGD